MTHYDTLGVKQNASVDEIKQAYKKLVKKYHPDVNPNNPKAEAKFKEIAAAYSELSEAGRRAKYDQSLRFASQRPVGGGWGGGFDPFGGLGPDVFTSVFRKAPSDIRHVVTSVTINFLEAKEKQVRTITYARQSNCKLCRGTGAKAYHTKPCNNCNGRGMVTQKLMGVLHSQQRCGPCKGTGKKVKTPCDKCKNGSISETASFDVNIPAGILDGKTLRIPGEGHQTSQGKGDLLIKVVVRNPPPGGPAWQRQGANVSIKLPVTYPTLIIGGKVKVPTIWGEEEVKIPPRTRVGETIMLPGKGFPRLGSIASHERGVQHIVIDLLVPDVHTTEHTQLLNKLNTLYE